MYLSYTQIMDMTPNIIQGKILVQETNKPLTNAHVQILYEQEETTTDIDGIFFLKSWQAFPLTLVVEHCNFKTELVQLQKPLNSHTIFIK